MGRYEGEGVEEEGVEGGVKGKWLVGILGRGGGKWVSFEVGGVMWGDWVDGVRVVM